MSTKSSPKAIPLFFLKKEEKECTAVAFCVPCIVPSFSPCRQHYFIIIFFEMTTYSLRCIQKNYPRFCRSLRLLKNIVRCAQRTKTHYVHTCQPIYIFSGQDRDNWCKLVSTHMTHGYVVGGRALLAMTMMMIMCSSSHTSPISLISPLCFPLCIGYPLLLLLCNNQIIYSYVTQPATPLLLLGKRLEENWILAWAAWVSGTRECHHFRLQLASP